MKLWSDDLEAHRAQAREFLQLLPGPPATPPPSDPLERAILMREGMQQLMPPQPSEMAEEATIPGPAGEIPVRIFRPEGEARGLYLHIHGGGWILGDPTMGDLENEHFARDLGLAVVSVDYRLAPEHPYPAGPDDCEAAAKWLLEQGPAQFGAERMFIGGESAGGHLTLVTALRVRDRLAAGDRLLGLNLVFGVFELNGTPSQFGNGGHADLLDPEGIRFMVECFTPGRSREQRRAPDISPVYADLAGLPPCLVSVGTYDHLFDDSLLIAPRLAAVGVEAELAVYPDSPHGFMFFPSEMSKAFHTRAGQWIQSILARSGS